ncbi:hypothetical protein [Mycolicibacterium phlei]|uniref:hypothetical protein n=1 Tax=Mycolicibacterium phlei TaxID=1771 RepID=UPI00226438E9
MTSMNPGGPPRWDASAPRVGCAVPRKSVSAAAMTAACSASRVAARVKSGAADGGAGERSRG